VNHARPMPGSRIMTRRAKTKPLKYHGEPGDVPARKLARARATQAKKSGGPALSPADVARYVHELIEKIRAEGPTRYGLTSWAMLAWGLQRVQAEEIVARAYSELAALRDTDAEIARDRQREQLGHVYASALGIGDLKAALKALEQLARIDGAYAAERAAVDHNVVLGPDNPETVRARIAELLANPEVRKKIEGA
jgi:hypothetical protein